MELFSGIMSIFCGILFTINIWTNDLFDVTLFGILTIIWLQLSIYEKIKRRIK